MKHKTSFTISIDKGTTSSRATAFDEQGKIQSTAQKEIEQIYPADGWVEHDPEEIWKTTVEVCKEVIASCGGRISRSGNAQPRETGGLWE